MIGRLVDERGVLEWTNEGKWVRAYWMTGMIFGTIRGDHAHRKANRLVVVVAGGCWLITKDRPGRTEVVRLSAGDHLLVPPMIWTRLFNFLQGTVVLVMADQPYDPAEVIGDYEEWASLATSVPGAGPSALPGTLLGDPFRPMNDPSASFAER